MLGKLRRGTFKHIEAELYDYHETLKRIKERKEEILFSSSSVDENKGGANSARVPNSPTERIATMLVMDKRLRELERITEAIETVYQSLDTERKKLIRLKYWTKPQTLTWEGIALKLNVSRATVFRWREEVVNAIAEKLGWY
mgnify:CR=1 FL=1